jgi:hypothetical protein
MMFRTFLVAGLLLIHGELRAEPVADIPAFAPKLIIYQAKGPANSCGPGCDRWIAVEGKVDLGAAVRIRGFLRDVKDTQRPIYFHSPGGAVEQSLIIGRLLRSRKAIARVGRTIVTACGAGTQVDDACLKIKTGGGEIQADIVTYHAMCNSACGYLFLGATTREVAPDAAMAVHNSRFTMAVHGHPAAQLVAAATERGIARADRERASFIAAMGISHELVDLVRTVKFETPIPSRGRSFIVSASTQGLSLKPHGRWKPQPGPTSAKSRWRRRRIARSFEPWSGGCFARTRIAAG